jgi:hypothetical protein
MSTPAGCSSAQVIVRAMSSATSVGPAGRPSSRLSQNGVSTRPGATRVTPMPEPVTSIRVFSARPVTAHLVTE